MPCMTLYPLWHVCVWHLQGQFMHESRHQHAMKRVRSHTGRFLTKAERAAMKEEGEGEEEEEEGATRPRLNSHTEAK